MGNLRQEFDAAFVARRARYRVGHGDRGAMTLLLIAAQERAVEGAER